MSYKTEFSQSCHPPPNGAAAVLLDGGQAAFDAAVSVGLPIATPRTASSPNGGLAMGAFGVVYKCQALQRECGVKFTKCKLEYGKDQYGVKHAAWVDRYNQGSHHHMLLEEVAVHRRATSLGHPNICRLLGAYETRCELSDLVRKNLDRPGRSLRLALVLEYFPGHDLSHVLLGSECLPGVMTPLPGAPAPSRPFNEVDKRNMFAPIASAVQALHAAGIVHRDIKPPNIVMKALPEAGKCPELALIDFGLAIDLSRGDVRVGRNSIIGDKLYAAPELFEGDGSQYLPPVPVQGEGSAAAAAAAAAPASAHSNRYTRAVDVYALGVTLYLFLLGFHDSPSEHARYSDFPYDFGDSFTFPQHCAARQNTPQRPLRFLNPQHKHFRLALGVSEYARDLLARMLHPNPHARITMEGVMAHPWLDRRNTPALSEEGKRQYAASLAAAAAAASGGGSSSSGGGGAAALPAAAAAAAPSASYPFWSLGVRGYGASGGYSTSSAAGSAEGFAVLPSLPGGGGGGGGGEAAQALAPPLSSPPSAHSLPALAASASSHSLSASASSHSLIPPPLLLHVTPPTRWSLFVRGQLRPGLPEFIGVHSKHAKQVHDRLKETLVGFRLPRGAVQGIFEAFHKASVVREVAPAAAAAAATAAATTASATAATASAGGGSAAAPPASGPPAACRVRGLTPPGMASLLVSLHVPPATASLFTERLFAELDKDGDGLVRWKDFVAIVPLLGEGKLDAHFPREALRLFWEIWASSEGSASSPLAGGAGGASPAAAAEAGTLSATSLHDLLCTMHSIHGTYGEPLQEEQINGTVEAIFQVRRARSCSHPCPALPAPQHAVFFMCLSPFLPLLLPPHPPRAGAWRQRGCPHHL